MVGVTPREYAEACRLRKVKRRLRAGRRGDRRDARRRLRIEQPLLRARRAQARHVAVGVPAGRRRHEHSLHDRRVAARTTAGRRHAARRVRGGDGGGGRGAGARLGARVSGGGDFGRRSGIGAVDPRDPRAPGRPPPRLDLPLDVQATAFQWQVWQALGAIPSGGRGPTARWRRPSAGRLRSAPSLARAQPIRSPSPSVSPASSPRAARRAGIAGARAGRRRCSLRADARLDLFRADEGRPDQHGLTSRSLSVGP